MRKFLGIGLLLAGCSAHAVTYTVQMLPSLTPSLNFTTAYGLNETGMVVGQSFNQATGSFEATVWTNGVITSLGFAGIARAVNNSGTVVGETGSARLGSPDGRAFKWDSLGGFVDLGDLGGPNAGAYDINEAGTITGFSSSDTITDPLNVYRVHAFRYENGSMGDMGTAATDGYSRGHGINAAGEIAGRASLGLFDSSEKHLAAWDANNNITSIPGSGGGFYSTAQQINSSGTIVGNGIDGNGDWLGMVWDANYNFLGWIDPVGGNASRAWSINDAGTIVGYTSNANNQRLAMVSYDGGATGDDLNALVLDLTGWLRLTEAYDINENGQIVGVGLLDGGGQAAFIATVVPVPAAAWLFLSAIGAVLSLGRLRHS